MLKRKNKTPAERALEVICAMANVPFEDFCDLLERSQGDNASPRECPESSYNMVKHGYFKDSMITEDQWKDIFGHVSKPRKNFGKK